MTKRKVNFILAGILMMFLFLNSVYAITGSIGNARMILYPEVNGWFTETIEKTILVKNVNDETISVTLEPDEDGKEFLEIIDNDFILEPETEKKAKFLVKVRKQGTYEGRISVFFSPIDKEGPGVVLSSTIIVIAKKDKNYEETQETNEENEEKNNETVNVFTGGFVGEDNKKSKVPLLLGISSAILLSILIILIFVINKTKNERKSGENKNNKKK